MKKIFEREIPFRGFRGQFTLFKNLLIVLILVLTSSAVFCESDAFLKRLKICNMYNSTYSAKGGTDLKRGVIGVYTDPNNLSQSCTYYIQESASKYYLCRVPTNVLRDSFELTSAKYCKVSSEAEIKEEKYSVRKNNYSVQRSIIKNIYDLD